MPEILITLLGGILLLLFSTKTLIKLSEALSLSLKLSPLIIGMTIVAIGTSLPELSVSTIASIQHDYALAIGNIIGSNITNILLVFSAGVLIGNLRIGTTKTPRNAFVLLFLTAFYSYAHYFNYFPRKSLGLALIGISFIITFIEYKWAQFGRTHEDIRKFKNSKRTKFSLGNYVLLIISVAGVIIGGYFIVTSTEKLSLITGLSTGVLGLTLTAVATSLPELLATIFSEEEHQEKMAIGNIIGSNIYNLFLIGGIIDLFSEGSNLIQANWLTLNIVTVAFVILILVFGGKTVPKWVGVASLACFLLYVLLQTGFHFI